MKVRNFIAIKQVGETPKMPCTIIASFFSSFFCFIVSVINICSKILVNFIESFFWSIFLSPNFFLPKICMYNSIFKVTIFNPYHAGYFYLLHSSPIYI